jgi:small conductance mechanosensitive channel
MEKIYLIVPLAIILITLLLGWLFRRTYFRLLRRRAEDDNYDPTNYKFMGHLLAAIVYVVGFSFAIYSFPPLRTLATSLLAGAGILAVAVGFASQAALANIVSGLFIVMFKPFRVNDRIAIREQFTGVVEDITLRHTVIRNFENRRIVIPNSIISNEVLVNSDLGEHKICRFLEIPVGFSSDLDLAKRIMLEEVRQHPNYFDNRTDEDKQNGAPEVVVRVLSLDEYAVRLRAWVWAETAAIGFAMHCELLESIKKRFDREGVVIPYPHRIVLQAQTSKSHENL